MSKKLLRGVGKVAMVVGAIAAIGTGIGAALGGTMMLTVFGTSIAASAIAGAASAISVGASLLTKPKAAKISTANEGRLNASINVRRSRVIAFGRTALDTDLRDQEYTGADKEYLHRFFVNAAHRINVHREIWFDDQLAWTAAGGVQGKFTGYLTVTAIAEGGPANAINISPRMGATRRYTGCAYVYMRFKLTGNSKKAESPFSQQAPTRITIVGEAIPCYDARQDSTRGGSGAHRANDQATWTFGEHARNPACQYGTYLLGWRIQNPQSLTWKLSVGCGTPPDRIDWASFIEAANLCDEPVTLAAGGTEPRYRGDGLFDEDDDPTTVTEAFKACMNADVDDQDGLIRLTVFHNDLATPDADFTEADTQDDYQWRQTIPLHESFNVVRGSYIEPDPKSLYQPNDYKEPTLPSPDGIERAHPADFGLVQSRSQAERLAKQLLQRQQYGGTFSATFLAPGWKVHKNSVVRLSFAPEGWTSKPFRVAEVEVREDGLVPMVLREEHADIYAWDREESPAVQIAEPTLYDPLDSPVVQAIGDAGTTADWGAVTSRPANLAALVGDEAIQNSLITDRVFADEVLDIAEKQGDFARLYADLESRHADLKARADTLLLSTTSLTTARTAWQDMLRSWGREHVANGTFALDTTGWTDSSLADSSWVSGRLRVTNSGTGVALAYQACATVPGQTYRVKADLFAGTSPAVSLFVGTAVDWADLVNVTGTGSKDVTFTATTATTYINLRNGSTSVAGQYNEFDNVSLKEEPLQAEWSDTSADTIIYDHFFADRNFPAGWALANGATTAANGVYTTVTDDSGTAYEYVVRSKAQSGAKTYTAGTLFKKDAAALQRPALRIIATGGAATKWSEVTLDLADGTYVAGGQTAPTYATVLDLVDEWLAVVSFDTPGDATAVGVELYPAFADKSDVIAPSHGGSINIRPPLIVQGDWKKLGREMLKARQFAYSAEMTKLAKAISEEDARRAEADLVSESATRKWAGETGATVGAEWSSNVTGRPAELTDGRVAAGLDGAGDVARDFTLSRLNTSNVLRYTGGQLFTGALNATFGARTGVNFLAEDGSLLYDIEVRNSRVRLGTTNLLRRADWPNTVPVGEAGLSGWGIDAAYSGLTVSYNSAVRAWKANTDYTVSFIAWATSGTAPLALVLDLFPDTLPQSGEYSVTATATRYVWTFNSGSHADLASAELRFIRNSGSTGTIRIADIMVEEANKESAWSPAPHDVEVLRRPGFTGDLNATFGAAWGANVTGRPTELTDGRVAAGLDGAGDVARDFTLSRLNTSNVLRYTGGQLFTGALNATFGAEWSSNVTGRPAELTDGRVAAGLDGAGDLARNITTTRANNSDLLRYTGGQLYTGALNATFGADLLTNVTSKSLANLDATANSSLFTGAPNLLYNGSLRLLNGSGWALGWSQGGGWSIAVNGGSEGNFATNSAGGTSACSSDPIPVYAGAAYTLQAEMFAAELTAGSVGLDIQWYSDSAGTTLILDDGGLSQSSGAWTKRSAQRTAPAGAVRARIRLFTQSASANTVAARRIKLAGATAETPFTDEATSSVTRLTTAGTGITLADSRNLKPIVAANLGYQFIGAISYVTAAGDPATCDITVGSGNLVMGSTSIPYDQMTAQLTGTGGSVQPETYLYVQSNAYVSGAHSMLTTTNRSDIFNNDQNVSVGMIPSFTYPTSGTGGGGGVVSDGCPWIGSYVHTERGWVLAVDVRPGDRVWGRKRKADGSHEYGWVEVESNEVMLGHCFAIQGDDSGVRATVSDSTPIELRDGSFITVREIDGHEMEFEAPDGRTWWERCVIHEIGELQVCKIKAHQWCYSAGDVAGFGILLHNPKP